MKDKLDFMVLGAAKAGTTSLFEYLRRHPELGLPADKEVPFFSNEATITRGWHDYMRRSFSLEDPSTKWGTVTPQYMLGGLLEHRNPSDTGEVYDERTVPRRIRDHLPDVRLIAILRDPTERARSHHRMAVMNRMDKRTFAQAIDDLLRPEAIEDSRSHPTEVTGYVTWGEYGRVLTPYFDMFPAEQLLVLFTDELENNPEHLLRRIYRFVGVSDSVPDNVGVRYRVGASERRYAWLGTDSVVHPWTLQHALARNRAARSVWHGLPYSTRRRIDRVVARSVYALDLWNRRSESHPADPDHATIARLRAHYAQDSEQLVSLLGSDTPWMH